MCSGTNFIKTLELNELVNHIAQLGCCPALDWEPQLNSLSPAPLSASPLALPCLSVFIYFFFSAAWKTIFVSKSVMSVEMNFRLGAKGLADARAKRAWQRQQIKWNPCARASSSSSWSLKKGSIKISVQRRKGLNDRKLCPKTQKPKVPMPRAQWEPSTPRSNQLNQKQSRVKSFAPFCNWFVQFSVKFFLWFPF